VREFEREGICSEREGERGIERGERGAACCCKDESAAAQS